MNKHFVKINDNFNISDSDNQASTNTISYKSVGKLVCLTLLKTIIRT
jgi:hypothetical protein